MNRVNKTVIYEGAILSNIYITKYKVLPAQCNKNAIFQGQLLYSLIILVDIYVT